MYTHVGMIGISWRDSSSVDPILNRNRAWHACNRIAIRTYKALCGKRITEPAPQEDSAWDDAIMPKDTRRITCKRCLAIIVKAVDPGEGPDAYGYYHCHNPRHNHGSAQERNACVAYGPRLP